MVSLSRVELESIAYKANALTIELQGYTKWCLRRDLNSYDRIGSGDFKSHVYTIPPLRLYCRCLGDSNLQTESGF